MPKTSTVAIYASVFAVIVTVVAVGYRAPEQASGVANATTVLSDSQIKQTSVNEIVATNIAANLAETTNLSVATNVASLSISLAAKNELAQSNDAIISKPQIIQPTSESRSVSSYVAVAGDTADSVAAKFGISKDTLKWANNLSSDAIAVGSTLQILPTDGILYTVKPGDTVQSISLKYAADQTRVTLYNDLDQTEVTSGAKIVIPAGTMPVNERPGYVAPRPAYQAALFNAGSTGVNSANNYRASAGNRYSIGYCTWYVYERRAELGRSIGSFWGNATSWANSARGAGFLVDRNPEVGSIIQNGGGLGHVAIVESIAPNGDLTLSEMNYGGGWNVKHYGRIIPAGQSGLYNYIH